MTDEARLEESDGGLEPVTDGWFVVNVRDATWWRNDAFGAWVDEDTPNPREAYAKYPRSRRERLEDSGLPWQR